jgi:hypothetical protein
VYRQGIIMGYRPIIISVVYIMDYVHIVRKKAAEKERELEAYRQAEVKALEAFLADQKRQEQEEEERRRKAAEQPCASGWVNLG